MLFLKIININSKSNKMKVKNKNNFIGFLVKVFFNKLIMRKENLRSINNI